jgi:RNA polymerase sigma-70 factor (ECF subfamily)
MVRLWEAGRAEWPGLALRAEDFERHAAARAVSADTAHAADVYLAYACASRVHGAAAAFERAFMGSVASYLARFRPTPAFVDEVSQILRERLLVGPSPKIAEYAGRGPLAAWVRVVAVRTALNLKNARGERPHEALDPDRPIADDGTSPEIQALRNKVRPLFKVAFREALRALSTDERNLLRLHYVDGLSMDELGRLFKVNRSTVFRRLGACASQLLEGMRDRLGAEMRISPAELESLAGAVKSDLDVSLADLLRSSVSAPEST